MDLKEFDFKIGEAKNNETIKKDIENFSFGNKPIKRSIEVNIEPTVKRNIVVNKNQSNNDIIKVKMVDDRFPILEYNIVDQNGTIKAGTGRYCDCSNERAEKYRIDRISTVINGIKKTYGFDRKTMKKLDPLLIDYLSLTNEELLDSVINSIRSDKELSDLKDKVVYDFTGVRNLKRRDKKIYRKLSKNAIQNGLTVIGYEETMTLFDRIKSKLFRRNEDENLETNKENRDDNSFRERIIMSSQNSLAIDNESHDYMNNNKKVAITR